MASQNYQDFEKVEREETMEKITILSVEQQNDFYDPARASNGGGYDQPLTKFSYKGIEGTLDDRSCGDFGQRFDVEWNGASYSYDSVGTDYEVSDFDMNNKEHRDFVETFNKEFSNTIRYQQDVEKDLDIGNDYEEPSMENFLNDTSVKI